jgi:hypothetical protein
MHRSQPTCRVGIADQGRGQFTTCCATEIAAIGNGRAEAEEDRFIDERLEPMSADDGDEQVDRIRTEIDRRTDDRPCR